MPKLGNQEQQAPGIEISDINDGDIISNTRKLEAGNGIVFEYTLPSGQVFRSEPVPADAVGKAIFGWLDAVKAQIVEDASHANDAALRAQRDRDLATDGISIAGPVPSDADLRAVGITLPHNAPKATDYVDLPLPSDAKGFAKAKLKEAKATVAMLTIAISQRQKALREAEKAVGQWAIAVKALTAKPEFKQEKRRGKK